MLSLVKRYLSSKLSVSIESNPDDGAEEESETNAFTYDKEARQSRAGHERPQRTWIGELTVG